LLKKKYGKIRTIALGDNLNDVTMLDACDTSYWVQKKDGSYQNNDHKHAKGIGPKGWNQAVIAELS